NPTLSAAQRPGAAGEPAPGPRLRQHECQQSCPRQSVPSAAMRGHKRFKDGSWRLIVDAGKDPMTGKRRQIFRTVRAPNTRAGPHPPAGGNLADVELARLVVEVTSGEVSPSAHITVGELLVRWVEHRRRAWEARSPGQPDWTLSVIRKHFIPRLGDLQLGKLRPVEIDHMYARWRQDGMAESSVRRLDNLLHS